MSASTRAPESPLALGIDAGGTETRWALAGPGGVFVAEGAVGGFSALEAQGVGNEAGEALPCRPQPGQSSMDSQGPAMDQHRLGQLRQELRHPGPPQPLGL